MHPGAEDQMPDFLRNGLSENFSPAGIPTVGEFLDAVIQNKEDGRIRPAQKPFSSQSPFPPPNHARFLPQSAGIRSLGRSKRLVAAVKGKERMLDHKTILIGQTLFELSR